MKILYVLHSFPPFHWRGTEVYALELAQAMSRAEAPHIFYLRHDPNAEGVTREEDSFQGLPVHRARLKIDPTHLETYSFHPELELRFQELLNLIQPQVVHFLYFTGGLSLHLPLIASEKGIRIFLTVTDFSGLCPRGQLLDGEGKKCEGPRQGLRCVPCLFAQPVVSAREKTDRLLREILPPRLVSTRSRPELALLRRRLAALREVWARSQAVIFPNPNAPRHYHAAGLRGKRELVRDYGIDTRPYGRHRKTKAEEVRIGFIGQLLPHKGLHLLAQAAEGLAGKWRLKIFGSLEDPGAREYFHSLKFSPEKVEFRGTFAFEKMNAVLEEIDILVVPSQWEENCPLIVKYAVATGTWAVLADQPGMIAERRGLERVSFFPPTDAAALRQSLSQIMASLHSRGDEDKEGENLALSRALQSGALVEIEEQAREFRELYSEPAKA